MNWEAIFICGLLVFAICSFILEKIPPDLTALTVFSLLVSASIIFPESKIPTLVDLLKVFSAEAPLTIGAMFIVNTALEKTGVIDTVSKDLEWITRFSPQLFILLLILIVALFSTVMNNTAVVVIMIPIALNLAKKVGILPSKILIPVSYAAIMGGCCTLIGTSTNLLSSNIMAAYQLRPLGMFELGMVGGVLTIVGAAYLAVFSGRFLPSREHLSAILPIEERKEYLVEAVITHQSSLINQTFRESPLFQTQGLRLIEVIRNNTEISKKIDTILFQAGDRIVLACKTQAFPEACNIKGLNLKNVNAYDLEQLSTQQASIVEGIITPGSKLMGQSPTSFNFYQQFQTILLAVHRRGTNLKNKLHQIQFQVGDTILLLGSNYSLDRFYQNTDTPLLDRSKIPAHTTKKKAPIAVAILTGIIFSSAMNIVPIAAGALLGVTLLLLTRCIQTRDAYKAIEWRVMILIYGALALGLSMESSGLAHYIGDKLVDIATIHCTVLVRPYALLGCVCLCTIILTELLTNNATAVIMTPIAISIAMSLGVDPRPFVIGACICSSASFSTPIGYQTNTYIYTIGGYRFIDFLKIGLPMNILFFTVSLFLIPVIWPF